MMRTSSRPWSISRLISGAALSSVARKASRPGRPARSSARQKFRNSSRMSPASWPSRAIILLAHAVAAEHAGIEVEHRLERRLGRPCVELRRRSAQAQDRSTHACATPRPSDWRSGRACGELEQRFLAKPEDRAAQHRRQRQIVIAAGAATRPSAIRSLTAICAGRLSRSAPATGIRFSFRLRDSAWTKRSRLRTSTSTSPASAACPLPSMISPRDPASA